MSQPALRGLAAEFAGTALLLTVVVGSGIMGETLAAGNTAVALLANSLATGLALFVLIVIFGPVSGAHFNPAVTLAALLSRECTPARAVWMIVMQIAGALAGVALAHAMFELAPFVASPRVRTGTGQWIAEAVATFGLVLTIFGARRNGLLAVAAAVGCYIAAAYWFTASTSFANPAVTLARAFTPTFSGIAPAGVVGFVVAQLLGALGGWAFARWLKL